MRNNIILATIIQLNKAKNIYPILIGNLRFRKYKKLG